MVMPVHLNQQFVQRQAHALHVSHHLQHSLQVLRYSHADLIAYIDQVCESNPLVEWDRHYAQSLTGHLLRDKHTATGDWQDSSWLDRIAQTDSIVDHLTMQLSMCAVDADTNRIIRYMIGSLDDSGYLVESVEGIAESLAVSVSQVEQALSLFQTFDPPGIGARTLRECLLAQTNAIPHPIQSLTRQLIDGHLDAVADKQWRRLADVFCVDVSDIVLAVEEIRRLQPRPAFGFMGGQSITIVPDVTIRRVADKWTPELNAGAVPRVRLAQLTDYVGAETNREAVLWYHQLAADARQVAAMLEHRYDTMMRVATVIVDVQQRFFDDGVFGLSPLGLQHVAERTGLHVSTVSRAVHDKFMATPAGVLPFRYFFSSSVPGVEDEGVSSRVVQAHLKAWIAAEDKHHPLSDEALRRRLVDIGVTVARRTVTKYREELRIPTSRGRRTIDD